MSVPALHTPDVAHTFYVDQAAGNDTTGDGSEGNPWATPQKAHNYLRDTHTWTADKDIRVYLKDGTYQKTGGPTTLDIAFTNGARDPSATQWVIWEAYPGHTPVLAPGDTGNASGDVMAIHCNQSDGQASFQQFVGLKLDGLGNRYGTHNAIGVYLETPSENCELVGCEITRIQVGDTGGSPTSIAQGIYIDPGAEDHRITRCLIHDIGSTSGTINQQEHGIYCGGHNNSFWNNVVWDIANGFGIQIYNGNNQPNGIYLVHNTVCGTIEKSCLIIGGSTVGSTVKNNIFRGATEFGLDFIPTESFVGSGNVLANNMFYQCVAGEVARNGSANNNQPAGWTFTGNDFDVTDPGHVDFNGEDFHLESDGGAVGFATTDESIDVDVEGTERDAEPDAGAYEYATEEPPPTGAGVWFVN